MTLAGRFWAKVAQGGPDECWPWNGARDSAGYGQLWRDGRVVGAHRVSVELATGVFPDEVDHACENHSCVNPRHLDGVTHRENMLRWGMEKAWAGHRAKTHCPNDHPYDRDNTYVAPDGTRACKACRRAARTRHRHRQAA